MMKKEIEDIYPLTIIKDRYGGVYSGGKYTAWNLDFTDIPKAIDFDDVTCMQFWNNNTMLVGIGKTPDEAEKSLVTKILKKCKELLGDE